MIEHIDTSTCNLCGVCLLVCPMDVIGRDQDGMFVIDHVGDCMSCFVCEIECRQHSIRVEPERRRRPSLLLTAAEQARESHPGDPGGGDDGGG